MNAIDYEAWRPALVAYYRREAMHGSADNVGKFGFPLTVADRSVIDSLAAALELAPQKIAA